jgi:hypothetical protein
MKAVYSYLSIDGICHTWDASNRGGAPLCGDDVFPLATPWASQHQTGQEPGVCLTCAELVMTMLEWEDYQERG